MIWPLLFAAAAAAGAPKPGELKTFGDWTVGCDNGRACHATSLMPESGDWDQPLTMSVEREPEPTAQPAITLLAEGGKTYRLRTAKGQPIRLVARSVRPDYRVDPRDLGIALAALRTDGRWMVEDVRGARLGSLSLAGVSAALLYIDDQQGRVGTVTALVRPGSKPATAVPPPPALPIVRSASGKGTTAARVNARGIDVLRKGHDCVPEDPAWPGYGVEQHPLDSNHVLVLLGCGAGAYNFSSIAYIGSTSGRGIVMQPADFDFSPSSGDGQPMLVNAEWDADGGILGSFAKGRGLGDCGTFADYAWDGQRFRLVERREMDECRGSIDYITTWRAKMVR